MGACVDIKEIRFMWSSSRAAVSVINHMGGEVDIFFLLLK